MNKIFKYLLLFLFLSSCSFNSDSSFWSQRNIDENQKILNIKRITKKEEVLLQEINKNVEINLSNFKIENYPSSNLDNNIGRTNYNGNLKSISRYKFSKIEKFDEYEPEIVINQNNIIFFDNKGTILKFDESSKLLWKKNYYTKVEKKLKPVLFLAANQDTLVVVDTIAKYFAINAKTGDLLWTKYNDSPYNSQIKIFKNKFYVVDGNNVLHCYSLKNGEEIWNFKTDKPLIKSQKKNSLIVKKNNIIFNNSVGDITAVNLDTGELAWQAPTQSKKIYDVSMFFKNSDLISANNSIFFSNNNNGFFSLDADSGIVNWKQKINSNVKPVFFNDLILTVTNEGYLVVIDYKSGKLVRSNYLLNNFKKKRRDKIKPIGFVVGVYNIYLTLNNGRLLVIDIKTGSVNTVLKIDNEKISAPIIQRQNLYVTKNNSIIKLN